MTDDISKVSQNIAERFTLDTESERRVSLQQAIATAIEQAACTAPAARDAAILQAATPNGWKLVPIDPPSTMLDELAQVDDISYAALLARYRKMLAAVPILQAATRDVPEYHSQGEVRRFMLDANVDGVEQFLEFVLAKEHDALIHDLETRCDPAGLVQENGLLKDQTRQLDAMIGRLKTEAQDADEPLNCDFCGVSVDDPWHTSDETRKHLHQCDACHNAASEPIVQAARTSPTADDAKHRPGCEALGGYGHGIGECSCGADDAKPVGEAVAWLWNEKPSEFNDYQSRPRVTFVRPKNTEAPGGMQALGVIAATAQPPKEDAVDDVEALMDRWGIPSHLRDRFRSPMSKLLVCRKQEAANKPKGDGND